MTISLLQTEIIWENPIENLKQLEEILKGLAGKTDLVILPEMFSTGFSMDAETIAETNDGNTITTLSAWARKYDLAITGSFIAKENNKRYNRGFFITPEEVHFYDKRHLFRMSEEPNHFSPGNKQLIVSYKEWNICLQICYDLRFPIWCRNRNNAYDLLIFVANWPSSRLHAWNILLQARAIENSCFVAGVNRVGEEPTGVQYSGGSVLFDMKGKQLLVAESGKVDTVTTTLSLDKLKRYRQRFPTWMDADAFTIEGSE